jgi:hypothetical protein
MSQTVQTPASPETPSATPVPNGASSEPKIPDKFVKDGKPDLHAFVTSYGELETRFNTKTETLKAELAAETLRARPAEAAAYVLPKLEGVDEKELGAHPMVEWWRNQAFESGIPQDVFAKGVEQYVQAMAPRDIPEETLKAELGEAFKSRIAAVDTWAKSVAKSDGEMQALQQIATSPDGIKLMERLSGLGTPQHTDGVPSQQPVITLDTLRSMQQSPKYWDPAQRDPDFIRQVEEGYAKLYPPTARQ